MPVEPKPPAPRMVSSSESTSTGNRLNNELGYTIAAVYFKCFLAMIEENDADASTKIGVDNAAANIDAVLDSETGAGGNTAIETDGNGNPQIRRPEWKCFLRRADRDPRHRSSP